MNTCSTCRWWDKKIQLEYDDDGDYKGWRWCLSEKCLMTGSDFGGNPGTGIYTSPDFGCNQWEEKEGLA